jgi:signal transduction histidine kinase
MPRTILLVEDSLTQALHVQQLLEQHGYVAELATDGKDGLERARELMPDLVISDVVMPEMDGYEFCRTLKADPDTRRIPFILLTDRRTPADILHGLEMGADNFITKPIDDDYLLTRVARIFENLEYRGKGKFEVEIILTVGPRRITINTDKQQIVELLFSTSEEMGIVNEKLVESERALREHSEKLETAVAERTKELRASLDALRDTMEDRRILADRLIRAEETERRRIARDVHDDSLQVMAAAAIRLSTLAPRLSDPEDQARVKGIAQTVQEAITRLRQLAFRLIPPALELQGLAAVLRMYFEDIQKDWNLEATLDDRLDTEPAMDVSVVAYRVIQEALMNVYKHAEARSVVVALETIDGGVATTVTDDGRGFAQDVQLGFGTHTMRERAEMAGGRFNLESVPGQGTTVWFWIPEGTDHTQLPGP